MKSQKENRISFFNGSTSPSTKLSKKCKNSRQLVIFINFPGVSNKKTGIYLNHAIQRAKRLHSSCSALHLLWNGHIFETVDAVSYNNLEIYSGKNTPHFSPSSNQTLCLSNKKNARSAIPLLEAVDGYYDHILVIGEMELFLENTSSQYKISGIGDLTQLTDFVRHICECHSANGAFYRIQICQSDSILIDDTSTLAQRMLPSSKKNIISIPSQWSVIARNGCAIDFRATKLEFDNITPFLFKAASNAWSYEKIQEEFDAMIEERDSKKTSSPLHLRSLNHYDLHLIYAKKESFTQFFLPSTTVYSKTSFALESRTRAITPPS